MQKKYIIMITSIIIVGILGICTWFLVINKRDTNSENKDTTNLLDVKSEVVIEVGDELPNATDFINNNIKDNIAINYGKDDDSFETLITYYNSNNEEVNVDEAIEYESLKKDYTSKEIVISTGEFKVTLNYENKDYYSKLIVKDTTEPKLILKDINIKENENVDINNFVDSVTDNSRKEVTLSYVSALTDYEKLEKLDLSIGEHDVFIEAKDNSDNKVVVQTKLTITKKQQTNTTKPTTNTNNQNINTNSSTNQSNTQSGNSSSNNSANIPQEQTPWERLGVSEYDYYNTPEFSWQTPYYSVKDYGGRDGAFNACKAAGMERAYEISYFWCHEVDSYSGDLLGYYLSIVE